MPKALLRHSVMEELSGIRSLSGNPTPEEEVAEGRKRALEYLQRPELYSEAIFSPDHASAMLLASGPESWDGEAKDKVTKDFLEQLGPELAEEVESLVQDVMPLDKQRHLFLSMKTTTPSKNMVIFSPQDVAKIQELRDCVKKNGDSEKVFALVPFKQQALVLAASYEQAKESAGLQGMKDQQLRRYEAIFLEKKEKERREVIGIMINNGDGAMIMELSAASAGDDSPLMDSLTADMLAKMFDMDKDIHDSDERLINMMYTLVCINGLKSNSITFLQSKKGQAWLKRLIKVNSDRAKDLDDLSHEEIIAIVRDSMAEDISIPWPGLRD